MRRIHLTALTAALLLLLPATASAKLRFFAAPGHKIGCAYAKFGDDRSVRCDLARVADPPPKPSDCELDYGSAFLLGPTGKAIRMCHGDTVLDPDARVLRYGKPERFGPFTCTARKARGMRCTSRTGHGFQVSPRRQKLW
jgi:hypothetical protein